jgi:hypothetical protein
MNTINGNFIEKSIPNTKNTTLNVNIGGVDATMTVEKFAAALPAPASSYKVYTALLTQTGISAPTANILENTLGGVPVLGYVSTGIYTITLANAFKIGKTAIPTSGININENLFIIQINSVTESTITIQGRVPFGGGVADDILTGTPMCMIEIRVYN